MSSFKYVPHEFKDVHPGLGHVRRWTGRQICVGCGLLLLRNTLTDWAVSKGCNWKDHPGLKQASRTLPARHQGAQS